jgi:hypothetical protein
LVDFRSEILGDRAWGSPPPYLPRMTGEDNVPLQ